MKRYFCLVLAFIVLLMTHSAGVKADDGVFIKSITADRYVAHVGDSISYTVAVTGDTTGDVYFDHFVYVNGQKRIDLSGWHLSANTFEVLCTTQGEYKLGSRVFKDVPGVKQIQPIFPPDMISPVTKVALPPQVYSVFPDKTSAKTGDSIAWTAAVSGGIPPLKYNWNIMNDGSTIMTSSGMKTSGTLTCPADLPGSYSAEVWVYDDGGTVVFGKSAVSVPVKQGLVIKNVEPNKEIAHTGDDIRWTVIEAIGGAGSMSYLYSFDVYRDGVLFKKNSWNKSINYTMKADKPGNYHAIAYVTDGKEQAAKTSSVVTKVADPLSIVNVLANRDSAPVGAEIIWTATTDGGIKPQYKFELWKGTQQVSGGKWAESNTYTWKASSAGNYHVVASVQDAFYGVLKQNSAAINVIVSSKLSVKSVHVDKTIAAAGEKITWTATAMGGSGTKSYKFLVYKNGIKLPVAGNFLTSSQLGYTAKDAGKYKVTVYVKDATATTSSPVASAETVVFSLLPLSEPLSLSIESLASLPPGSSPILLPGNVSILMTAMPTSIIAATPKPSLSPTATPTPTMQVFIPEPIEAEPTTTYPMVELITGFIFFTPQPTVGID